MEEVAVSQLHLLSAFVSLTQLYCCLLKQWAQDTWAICDCCWQKSLYTGFVHQLPTKQTNTGALPPPTPARREGSGVLS